MCFPKKPIHPSQRQTKLVLSLQAKYLRASGACPRVACGFRWRAAQQNIAENRTFPSPLRVLPSLAPHGAGGGGAYGILLRVYALTLTVSSQQVEGYVEKGPTCACCMRDWVD